MISFKFLSIPVEIRPTFWIFLLFFSDILIDPCAETLIWGGVLVLSVLVHEYGHALTARYFGANPSITLEDIGGFASYHGFGISPWQTFLIVLNGPLLESLLVFIPYYLLESTLFLHAPWIRYILHVTMDLNFYLILLNLIPIPPLDGASLVGFFINKLFKKEGEKITLIIGLVVAAMAIPYLFYVGRLYFGTLLAVFSFRNYQLLRSFASPSENLFSIYMRALEAQKNGDLEITKPLLYRLVKSKDRHYKAQATERLAAIYYQEGHVKKAYSTLLNGDHQQFEEGKCLLCKLAFEYENYSIIANYSREIYAIEPTREIALLNSKAFALLGDQRLADGWQHTASQFPCS